MVNNLRLLTTFADYVTIADNVVVQSSLIMY